LLVLAGAVGCGAGRGELSGKVTYQGKAVTSGSVQAVGSDNLLKASVIAEDGTYSIKDLPTGKLEIAVFSPKPGENLIVRKKDVTPPPKHDTSKWFAIPEKYGDHKTSEVTFELGRGENKFDIELK